MEGMDIIVPIIAILSVFVGFPGVIGTFIYKNKKQKIELEKIKYQKEILELEVQKQDNSIKLLAAETEKIEKEIDRDWNSI